MKVGASSACFFPCDTLKALAVLGELGIKHSEIFMGSHSEAFGEYLRMLCEEKDKWGINITSVHPFTSGYEYILFFSEYARRIDDGIEYYKNYFSAAAALGAKYVVFHGDNKRSPFVGVERYAEIYARLDGTARTFGVRLSQENVSTSHIGSPENLKKLKGLLPDICFTLDIKQSCRGGYDPYDTLCAMGAGVKNVHLNDWESGRCRLPCRGSCDLSGIVNTLNSLGYDGAYIIEVYRGDFENACDIIQARQDFINLFDKE